MATKISASEPDWSREIPRKFYDPGRRLLRTIRKYQKAKLIKYKIFRYLIKSYWVIEYRIWSIVTGAEIDLNCNIGGGLLIPHPNGIVIHPNAVIGPNCLIFQQVTIVKDVVVGGHVDIGAGAKVMSSVVLGDHSRVGANAVVTKDVPNKATVAGVPARVIS